MSSESDTTAVVDTQPTGRTEAIVTETSEPISTDSVSNNELPIKEEANTPSKLYCGKYQNVTELEKGYNSQQKFIDELRGKLKEKETILDKYTPPSEYNIPEGVPPSRAEMLKELAVKSLLTQEQFNKIVDNIVTSEKTFQESLNSKKQKLGDDFTKIKSYVEQNYPKPIHDTVMTSVLTNEELYKELLNKRNESLNSSIPTMGTTAAVSSIDDLRSELLTVSTSYDKAQNHSERIAHRSRMIDLSNRIAELRNGTKN